MRFILLSVALSSLGRVIASNSPPPAATITPPPSRLSFAKALLPRQADGPYACSWFNTLFEQCSNAGYSQDAGVSGLPYCLCYGSNDRYDPYKADSYIEQCYNYAGTDTSFASGFATYLDLCSSAGDVRAAESSSYAACAAVNSIFSRCADYGYDRVVGPSQPAACVCYSQSLYKPTVLDNLYSACFSYAQTADPELAGSMWLNLGYCSRGGDVQAALSQGTQLCKSVASVLSSCSTIDQFRTGLPSDQASYFCYDQNTNFIGALRDSSLLQCRAFATDNWPTVLYTVVSSYMFMCSNAGDVRARAGTSGRGGSSGGGDGVPSPRPGTSMGHPTGSPNIAVKSGTSLVGFRVLAMLCVTLYQLL